MGTRVLVTYGWCRTAYVICERLARRGYRVSACGESALSMTRVSRYVDTFDRVPDPFGNPRLYAAAIGEVARNRRAALVMPAHEDFLALAEFRELLPPGVIIAAPTIEQGREVIDKWKLICRAKRAGIPVPVTVAPTSLKHAEQVIRTSALPLVLKPRRGNGAKGIVVVRDPETGAAAFEELLRRFQLGPDELPLIQQYLNGAQLGSCFLSAHGEVLACFVERYIRCKQPGFGTSVLRERSSSDDIERLTRQLARELRWTGVGHLDFIMGDDGRPYLLEMNPRFWGALSLAVENGFDFPVALASLALTGAPDPRCFTNRTAGQSLWIAGELMACLDDLRHLRMAEVLKAPARFWRARHFDDFRLEDPLPLFLELAYYFSGFLRSGGDANPVRPAMVRATRHALNQTGN